MLLWCWYRSLRRLPAQPGQPPCKQAAVKSHVTASSPSRGRSYHPRCAHILHVRASRWCQLHRVQVPDAIVWPCRVHHIFAVDDDPRASNATCSGDDGPWWDQPATPSRMSIDDTKCRVCQRSTTNKCPKCHSVFYCSATCQRKNWDLQHNYECKRLCAARQRALADKAADLKEAAAASAAAAAVPDAQELAPVPQRVLCPYDLFMQLMHADPSIAPRPPALSNHGNSCYANSVLQCLLATRSFRNYLISELHPQQCARPAQHWCLVCELRDIARVAVQGGTPHLQPLLRHLRCLNKSLAWGRQEDSHEFFYSLVNTMESILLKEAGGKERHSLRTQETTLVNHVFGGYSRTQVVCHECGAVSRRFEHFMDVPIDIPGDLETLEDALAIYCQRERLEGDNQYQCDACRRRVVATRGVTFEAAPNCLVLCLKRFGRTRFGKNNRKLEFGENLDLKPFMDPNAMDQAPAIYELYGVIVHIDNMNSTTFGHYVAYVRGPDGRWFMCDDDDVRPVPQTAVLRNNAYMLFYQRDNPKPAPNPHYRPPKSLPPQATPAAAAPHMNGHHAAAEGAVPLQQGQPETATGPTTRAQLAAAVAAAAQVALEGSDAAETAAAGSSGSGSAAPSGLPTLARVSTAPAALARLQTVPGSESEDSDTAATPQPAAAPTRTPKAAAAAAGSGSMQATGTLSEAPLDSTSAAAGAGSSATGLPAVQYTHSLKDGNRLVLRFKVPGLTSSSQLGLLATASELQLDAPGFAPLLVPLADGLVPLGACWAAGTGRLYRRKGLFKVSLQLVLGGQGGSAAPEEVPDILVHDSSLLLGGSASSSIDSSSEGSDSEVWQQQEHSLLHVATSEADLQALLGRYADSRAKQLLQRLPRPQQPKQGSQQQGQQGAAEEGVQGAEVQERDQQAAGKAPAAPKHTSNRKSGGKKGKRK